MSRFIIVYFTVLIVLFIAGVYLSNNLVKIWGKDPNIIVIDEYSCFLIPLYFTAHRLLPLIITFFLFRFFDIVKPPPLRKLERLPGGWGIMLDDLAAALYSVITIIIINHFVRL